MTDVIGLASINSWDIERNISAIDTLAYLDVAALLTSPLILQVPTISCPAGILIAPSFSSGTGTATLTFVEWLSLSKAGFIGGTMDLTAQSAIREATSGYYAGISQIYARKGGNFIGIFVTALSGSLILRASIG